MAPELGIPPEIAGWLVLAALPLVLAGATCFTKISVVLAALRAGLGAEALLPYGAMLALALLLTAVVMGPVGIEVASAVEGAGGVETLVAGRIDGWWPVLAPVEAFLRRHASEREMAFFAELQGVAVESPLALVPAFLVTELTEALQMAVLIVLPFVVVDLLAAQTASLLGVPGQPLPLVTLPLKILLFLAAGGWDIVLGSVVAGYT